MILGIFPGFTQAGGIERISQHSAVILKEIAVSQQQLCQLISLNDPILNGQSFMIDGQQCQFRGFGRKKWKFIFYVFSKTYQARLVYLGHPNLAPLGFFLRILNPKVHYWVAAYGVEVWQPLSFLYRWAFQGACGIIALSQYTGEQVIQNQRVNPCQVTVIPPALDPEFMDMEMKKSGLFFNGQKMILSVCRLISTEPGKGVDTVIKALCDVLKVVSNVLYVVVGEGDLRSELQHLAKEIGLESKVYFVGEKRNRDLKEYYSRADIFVLPSCQEGFGVAFLEAMNFAKPVIAGNHGGTPELIKDNVSGFLVEYGDAQTLARRLISLLQDENLCRKMGEAGRQLVRQNYTFAHLCQRLTQALLK